jgi:hypothetical protein
LFDSRLNMASLAAVPASPICLLTGPDSHPTVPLDATDLGAALDRRLMAYEDWCERESVEPVRRPRLWRWTFPLEQRLREGP